MIAHGDEEVKEQGATLFHFHLHGAALLEVVAAADDQSEILSTKLRVRVRGMSIGVTCRCENGGNLHALSQTLFTKGETLEFFQAIPLS